MCQRSGTVVKLLKSFKLDEDFNIKLSDFGVSFWSLDKGVISTPGYYVGGKGMYEHQDNEETVIFGFDLRYFLIVVTCFL